MKFRFFISILFFAGLISSHAASIEQITFPAGNETAVARRFMPDGQGPFPAVILIHEWWGLNEWMNQRALELAEKGFFVLTIDLYRGKSTANPEIARQLMQSLPKDRALRDLSGAWDYLEQQPCIKKHKIAILGWGMGGEYTILFASAQPDLNACVIFYGNPLLDPKTLAKINCPTIGFFGAEDQSVSTQDVKQFELTMQELKKNVSIRIYERAGHAFMNDNRPSYNKPAATDAWKRAITFLFNTLAQ